MSLSTYINAVLCGFISTKHSNMYGKYNYYRIIYIVIILFIIIIIILTVDSGGTIAVIMFVSGNVVFNINFVFKTRKRKLKIL